MRNQLLSIRPVLIAFSFGLLATLTSLVLAQQSAQPQENDENRALLPIIFSPAIVTGEIGFSSPRFAGVTTFVPQLTLDFSAMQFDPQPLEMKIWYEDEDPASVAWVPYTLTAGKEFVPKANGVQKIFVTLRAAGGYRYEQAVTFFYIAAADFAVPDKTALAGQGWTLIEDELPLYVQNDTLRLGSSNFGCDNMPYPAVATAAIDMVLPEEGDYHLRLVATITTYDQLPDPSQATFDAFELFLDGALLGRYGNPDDPLDCGTKRKVDIDKAYDLQPHAGVVILRLENHSRFDEFYNTYTDIQQVWVEQGDPPASAPGVSGHQVRWTAPRNEGVEGPKSRE